MTDQKTPESPQERLEGGSAAPEPPEAENGPQNGAQPRGPVDWARQQAAEREQQPATDPRQPAYDAVFAYIRELGDYMPPTVAHRNAVIWRGVHAALDPALVTRDRELQRMKILVAASESDAHAVRMAAQYADKAIENGERAERAEATVGRVRALAAELFVEGSTHTHRAIGRQLLNTLQPPEPDETTPADEARLDRAHWDAKYAGEGQ
ncbi:hypothetical protein ACFWHL_16290 [Streptomyces massasporeus]